MRMMNGLIDWGGIIDNHVLGITPLGKVFIRFNRQEKVTGMYTMFGEVEKFVPQDETQETFESAKKILFEIVKNKIEKDILLKKDLKL
jgi:hypothetical protein